MTAPTDRRTERLGLYLAYELAPTYPLALAMLNGQLRLFDGFANHGETHVQETGEKSPTEATMLARQKLCNEIDDIRDALLGAEIAAKHYGTLLGYATALDLPALEEPRCRQGQRKIKHEFYGAWREGWNWSDDEDCADLPVKRGLCQRHYSQWYRKQAVLGLSTIHLYAPGRPA